MPTTRLTQVAVERLKPPPTGRVDFFDSLLPSFGLRISETGHRSWVLFYRIGGKQRRFTIGTLAAIPKVDEARDRARELLREVARGVDPAATKAVATTAQRPIDTVARVAAQFIERHAKPKNRSWQGTERLLALHVLPRWGDTDVRSITRSDVRELLDQLADNGLPVGVNRVLATVRKMFGWAVERELLDASPAAGIKAPGKETQRDRVLPDAELVRVWEAAGRLGGVPAALVRLLILTGQRRAEVAGMKRADLDLERRVWTIPRELTKGDRSHEVPLSSQAIEVLAALPRTGAHVLSANRLARDGALAGYSKIKARLDREVGPIEPWRFHDLRRTAGTGLARLGTPVSTISRILNHAEGGVTKIYNRHGYLEEKRQALESWGARVETLVAQASADNVVVLRA